MTNEQIRPRMMHPDEIKEALRPYKLYVVAEETGLSYMTLNKIVKGEHKNINFTTIMKLSEYLSK